MKMLIISWIHNNTEQYEQNKFKLVSLRIPTMNAISNAMHMRNSKTIGDEPNANAPEPMLPILSLSLSSTHPKTKTMHTSPRPPLVSEHTEISQCRRPRRPHSPITPRTRMPTRAQQRPRLIQRAPLPLNRDTLARARATHAHRTGIARRIRRRSRPARARRRRNADGRRPPAHPAAHAAPVQTPAARLAVVVDRDDDFVFAGQRAAAARLVVAEEVEL